MAEPRFHTHAILVVGVQSKRVVKRTICVPLFRATWKGQELLWCGECGVVEEGA
jgi:hypothetical protein